MDGDNATVDVSSTSSDPSAPPPPKRARYCTLQLRLEQFEKKFDMDMKHGVDDECSCPYGEKDELELPVSENCVQAGMPQSNSNEQQSPSFAKTIFGQVKELEDNNERLEKELANANLQIHNLLGQLAEERRINEKLVLQKEAEFTELNEKLEEERKGKEIAEIKLKKMEKNLFNLYTCLGKLIRFDDFDHNIFQPIPGLADRQKGAMNLIQNLLQLMTGKVVEAEKREEIREKEKIEHIQPKKEEDDANEGKRWQCRSKTKKKVTFNLTYKLRRYSISSAIVQNTWVDDEFSIPSSEITGDCVKDSVPISFPKETKNVGVVESVALKSEERTEVVALIEEATSEENQEKRSYVTDESPASSTATPTPIFTSTNDVDLISSLSEIIKEDHGVPENQRIGVVEVKKFPPTKKLQILLTRVDDLDGPFGTGAQMLRVNLQQVKAETTSSFSSHFH